MSCSLGWSHRWQFTAWPLLSQSPDEWTDYTDSGDFHGTTRATVAILRFDWACNVSPWLWSDPGEHLAVLLWSTSSAGDETDIGRVALLTGWSLIPGSHSANINLLGACGHFISLKTELIFVQLTVAEGEFPWNSFINTWQFSLIFHHFNSSSSTRSRELRQQFAACSGWSWQW